MDSVSLPPQPSVDPAAATDRMFTGLVEATAAVSELLDCGPGKRLVIAAPRAFGRVEVGDSVAVNGCCLTVVACVVDGHHCRLAFEAGEETLNRTNLGELEVTSVVNLERSLRVGDRVGGHFVTGHIDCVGTVRSRNDDGDWATFWFDVPAPWRSHLASKGSIAIDGVSLTIVAVDECGLSVAAIPHTLGNTTLGGRLAGECVNVETDVLAKYVERSLDGTK